MQFSIHASGRSFKFMVPAVPAGISGVWSEPDQDILRPDHDAIRAAIPARYRKAIDRHPLHFWFDSECRWNGERATSVPYTPIYGSRGKVLFTLYAIPCK